MTDYKVIDRTYFNEVIEEYFMQCSRLTTEEFETRTGRCPYKHKQRNPETGEWEMKRGIYRDPERPFQRFFNPLVDNELADSSSDEELSSSPTSPAALDEPDETTPLINPQPTNRARFWLRKHPRLITVYAVMCIGAAIAGSVTHSKIYLALTQGSIIEDNEANRRAVHAITLTGMFIFVIVLISIGVIIRCLNKRRRNQEARQSTPVFRGDYEVL